MPKKIKLSVPRKSRKLSALRQNSNNNHISKQSSIYINTNTAARNKFEELNKTKRRISSVKKDINDQLQIAHTFMKTLTTGPNPVLTPTHLMNIKYNEFTHIVIIDNQNSFYASDITNYKSPRDMVLDIAQLMGHWALFIIVKPKLNANQTDYYQDKDNSNIITFNIDCTTLNDGRMQKCHEVHGFNESDDYLLLLLYKYFKKHLKAIDISILSGDNYKHTYSKINYFYLDERVKASRFNYHKYYEQFSNWVLTNRLTDQIQDDIGW